MRIDAILKKFEPIKMLSQAEEAISYYWNLEEEPIFADLFYLRQEVEDEQIRLINQVEYYRRDLATLINGYRSGNKMFFNSIMDRLYQF